MKPRHNLVLVIFDTARRDRFGCYGYPRPTTPAVDQLAREGLLFEHMITPAPWTLPSHASLFTGLYPREHGATWPVPVLGRGYMTLARHLREQGYTTACLSANPLLMRSGLEEGFQIKHGRKVVEPGLLRRRLRFALGTQDHGSEAFVRHADSLLRGTIRPPFFMMFNFMECHWLYFPPRRFQRRLLRRRFSWRDSMRWGLKYRRLRFYLWEVIAQASEEELALLHDMYDAALATADDRFGLLLEVLRRRGHADDTVVVLAADHGENIGDHGLATHQGSLHRTLTHVPFVARVPGRAPARVPGLAQFTDVFGGLSRVLGNEPPSELMNRPMAVDPFGPQAMDGGRPYAFGEWQHWGEERLRRLQSNCPHYDLSVIPKGLEAVQDRRFKLVVRLDRDEHILYDMAADPGETRDVAADYPQEVGRLRGALAEWRTQFPAAGEQVYSPEDVQEVEARLRALGYV